MGELSRGKQNKECNVGICIPTYNRPELLKRSVESIIEACKEFNVKIFISDNSVNDLSRSIVNEFMQLYHNIVYRRNRTNIGMDRNIVMAVDICDCKFAWLIGDDDLLKSESVKKVLEVIDKYPDIPFIFANYSYVNNDYTYILKERVLNLNEDKVVPANVFLEKYVWAMGFIGSCIVNKDFWDKVDRNKYIGNFFPHIGNILEACYGQNVYIISYPLVLNRSENTKSSTWSQKAFNVYFGFEKTLKQLRELYGNDIIDKALNNSSVLFKHRSLIWIASKKADGVYNYNIYKKYIKNNYFLAHQKIFAFSILFIPRYFFSILKFIVKTLPSFIKRKKLK